MRYSALLICLCSALSFLSCKTLPTDELRALTYDAKDVSYTSATVAGKANLPASISTDTSFGIMYSTSPAILRSNSTVIEAKEFDSNYCYEIKLSSLLYETDYYFRAFIRQGDIDTYGDVRTFKTLRSPVKTLSVEFVEATSELVFTGSYDLDDKDIKAAEVVISETECPEDKVKDPKYVADHGIIWLTNTTFSNGLMETAVDADYSLRTMKWLFDLDKIYYSYLIITYSGETHAGEIKQMDESLKKIVLAHL